MQNSDLMGGLPPQSIASSKEYPPVAIGGIGGSGTRLIAEILRKSGFWIGDPPAAKDALEYWVKANKRAIAIGESKSSNFHLLNFDKLVDNPCHEIGKLFRFLGYSITYAQAAELAGLVIRPDSIGRFRDHSLESFRTEHIDYVEQLGFNV